MATDPPSRQVLDEAPARVLKFLIGVSSSSVARMALLAVGYSQEEHDSAWALLKSLGALGGAGPTAPDKVSQDAVNELNAWDEPNFPVVEAIVARRHPEQAEFLFAGLEPSDVGSEAVHAISTLLDRLDQLQSGKGRDKSVHKADKDVVARLAARGYTSEERNRLRDLVKTALTVVPVTPISTAESDAIKIELAGFFNEWSTQARKVIKRRDILIRLGLAKRLKRAKAAPAPPPAPATGNTSPG